MKGSCRLTQCIFRNLEPLSLGDEYWNIRDAIVQTELLVLRMVAWQVTGISGVWSHKIRKSAAEV